MSVKLIPKCSGYRRKSQPPLLLSHFHTTSLTSPSLVNLGNGIISSSSSSWVMKITPTRRRFYQTCASLQEELDLTEDNVKQVLSDARDKFSHIFDTSVGMTGVAELAELDGPFVKISLKGRFWHERSLILARLGNYLKQRIPEILEVDIEDEKQLDDSPENF